MWINYKKSRKPFSENELSWLYEILEKYSNSEIGSWLYEISYKEISYYWTTALNIENGVIGLKPVFGNEIYMMASDSNHEKIKKSWIQSITSTIIHELYHIYQQHKYGKLLWIILRIPELMPNLYGKIFIEKDAFKIENEATEFIQNNFKW
jgi:hypothetical protein